MLVMLLLPGAARAQVRSVTLQPLSKDFGYFPGDIVQGTAIIDVGPDTVLDRDSLPYAGPIATSLDLRAIAVSDEAVPGGRHITIHAQYQTFATPDEVSRVDVPGYQVAFMQGQKRLVTNVPGFGFAVSPFRHDILGTVDLGVLRPDHPFATVDVSRSRFALLAGLVLMLMSLLCLGATRGWLASARGGHAPFARVARELRGFGGDRSAREALLLLHRAFDESAGERVLAEDVDKFVERAPRFAPLRSDIARFFDMSRACFFGGPDANAVPTPKELSVLCRQLARAERW